MSDQPLHEHDETHLWKRTFAELVARTVSPTDEVMLIIGHTEAAATRLKKSVKQNLHTGLQKCLTYGGEQDELPYEPDSVDVTVHLNEQRNPYKYHQPLYQATEVTRKGGTIVYRAPQRLAHSEKAEVDTIYSLNWEANSDPSLAAVMTVTSGDVGSEGSPGTESGTTDTGETTVSAFL